MSRGNRNQQAARAGEYYIAAEINRRGANAVTLTGNAPQIDVLAWDNTGKRRINIQVKTRRAGSWPTSIREGRVSEEPDDESTFWIFVDLSGPRPGYFVVPDWWIRNDIASSHSEYLNKHGGVRPGNPDSLHHGIRLDRILGWRDRWDVLRIFPNTNDAGT